MHWDKSILLITILFGLCFGHGYLTRPASRNNIRLVMNDNLPTECPYGSGGCTVPDIDYEKQSGAAGGPGVVHATCPFGAKNCAPQHGMCGDKFDAPQDHMEGGRFSSGLVNGVYAPGQTIYIDLTITAHHLGYHEFVLYDVSDDATAKTVLTSTVPSYQLKIAQPQITHTKCEYWTGLDPYTKWCMPHPTGDFIGGGPYVYTSAWVLPANITCKRCVLQWHWVTGNSPGGANPEEFWGCADVTIRSSAPFINHERGSRSVSIDAGLSDTDTTPTAPPPAPAPAGAVCVAIPGKGSMDDAWCQTVKCDQIYVDGGYCKWSTSSSATTTTGTSTSTPATAAPATKAPATAAPATAAPATKAPATAAPTTKAPATAAPATAAPATKAPATAAPATKAPATAAPATKAPATAAPATAAPATKAPATAAPTKPATGTATSTTGSSPPPSSAITKTCQAVPGNANGITDVWCQQANCAESYVTAGFCRWI